MVGHFHGPMALANARGSSTYDVCTHFLGGLGQFLVKMVTHRPEIWHRPEEIVERRHGEPIQILFLPKMGLLDSLADNEKNCWL
jgi:hypothetical protein